MESKHLWVLLALLVGLIVLFAAGHFRTLSEGFQGGVRKAYVKSSTLRCPPLYTFFNDEAGASFCCRGDVNPYTHTCTSPLDDDLCAFVAGTPDPRNPKRKLRLCSDVIGEIFDTGSTEKCPTSLPHYATDGVTARCCKTGTTTDGSACVPDDLRAEDAYGKKTDYCIVEGQVAASEKRCTELKMLDTVHCPDGFQSVGYVMREREVKKYGKGVQALILPTCYRVNESCIPDAALDYVSTEYGAFADRAKKNADGSQDWSTWKWSCSGLEKTARGLGEEVTQQSYP